METEVAALPDDALAGVLRLLPPQSLAVSRCVCKAALVDARALLLPHLLPHSVHGIFVNYIDHGRPHHFVRPSSPSTFPTRIDGMLGFVPHEGAYWWLVLDHCNGLLLCNMERMQRDLCVCNPATRRWTLLPWHPMGSRYEGTYLAFDPAVSPHYEVFLIPDMPKKPEPKVEEEYYALLLRQQNIDVPSGLALMFSSLDDGVGLVGEK